MVVLKNIPRILSPQLLSVLARMGHGDEIVLADANFPSASICNHGAELVRADGHGIPELLKGIMKLLPLDAYVPAPVMLMNLVPGFFSWISTVNSVRGLIRMSGRASSKTGSSRSKSSRKRGSAVEISSETEKVVLEVPQLAWRILSEENAKELNEIKDVDEIARRLAKILSLTTYEVSLKETAQLEYFMTGYWYARKECKFNNEQTSTLITILHILLENIKTKGLSLGENLKELQGMLCGVDVPDSQTAIGCFSSEMAIKVAHYIQSSLFQHYTLYTYLFTEDQKDMLITSRPAQIGIPDGDKPLLVPPLDDSIPMVLYERCFSHHSPPPSPTEEQDSEDARKLQGTPSPMPQLSTHECSMPVHQESVPCTEPSVDQESMAGTDTLTIASNIDELEMSEEDIKSLVENTTLNILRTFQAGILKKIKEKEEMLGNRLSKLEKTLNKLN